MLVATMALRRLLTLQQHARLLDAETVQSGMPAVTTTAVRRGFASSSDDDPKITVEVSPYRGHRIEPPTREVETSKSELWKLLTTMTRMRRLELSADQLYKTKLARGFLHLADGQEAIPAGMEAAADFKDSVIQSYRDHLTYLGRGGTIKQVAAELMGRYTGASKGIGGSMHLYFKEHNFYGGSGIVGEQVPVGAGLAFAHKYRKDGSVSFTIYGDGAANQGQIFEAFNIAALWDLPAVFVVENNHYGMGTAEARAAKSPQYYTRGDYMPGMWVDGMDVLAVKNAVAFAKQYAVENGPLILEMDTYRYHGHSISDPGSTYRTRDEIQGIRQARDPIEHVKNLLKEHGWAEATEIKRHDKKVRAEVNEEIEEAKKGEYPPTEFLWRNTYKDGLGAQMRPMEIGQEKIPV